MRNHMHKCARCRRLFPCPKKFGRDEDVKKYKCRLARTSICARCFRKIVNATIDPNAKPEMRGLPL